MARKKCETSKVYTYEFDDEQSYSKLPKTFNDMHMDSINAFKKVSLQKQLIVELEKEITYLRRALDSLKEVHTSLVDKHYNVSDTLV